jgi:glyoxylase-like metal-dependent hydrolase (beta-lactamase superfamily II)
MPKPARAVLDKIFAFPPNRETLGATAYFIVENDVNILLDCPAWHEENQQFLQDRGGVKWLLITHRGGISQKVKQIQQTFGCDILIQEQEAYLLPGLKVTTFEQEFTLSSTSQMIWTPGHSPGSSCFYYSEYGGVLFSGRHLLPDKEGNPMPLRTSKTFHWKRQIQSIEKLRQMFSPETLEYLCPGANTGFLRGKRAIDGVYQRLAQLNLEELLLLKPGL